MAPQIATESIEAFDLITATDSDGYTHTAQDAVRIQLGKSHIQLKYPLVYQSDINSNPREVILLRNSNLEPFNDLTNPCVDDNSANAACGWVLDQNGNRIPGSQGFCCKCSALSLFGLGATEIRSADAGISCSLLNAQAASAHCMRLDALWYSAYEILAPSVDFNIPVSVSYCPASAVGGAAASGKQTFDAEQAGNATSRDMLFASAECSSIFTNLSPSNPVGCLATKIVDGRIRIDSSAEALCNIEFSLEGDFAAWEGTPDLSSKLLVRPATCTPASSPGCIERVHGPAARWMLLPMTAFGSECNKIGVGWSSFRTQGDRCGMPAQSCLGQQIEDFYNADMEKIAAGVPPDYMLTDLPFGKLLVGSEWRTQLNFQTDRFQKSVVNMYISADSIAFVRNVSPGEIVFAQASAFESLSGTGRATVGMRNLGMIESAFTVALSCSSAVQTIPSRQVSLAVTAQSVLEAANGYNPVSNTTFALRVANEEEAAHGCVVSLFDAKQTIVDTKTFNFTTTAKVVDRGEQGGTPTGPEESSAVIQQQGYTCDVMCSKWYDAICAFRTGCWQKLLTGALVTLGAVLALVLMWRMRHSIADICSGGGQKSRPRRQFSQERFNHYSKQRGKGSRTRRSTARPMKGHSQRTRQNPLSRGYTRDQRSSALMHTVRVAYKHSASVQRHSSMRTSVSPAHSSSPGSTYSSGSVDESGPHRFMSGTLQCTGKNPMAQAQ